MVKIICEQCSQEFEVKKYRENTAKFCSMECYHKYESINRRGKNNPMYGRVGWRRGLTKETDKRIRIGAEKLRGRRLSEEHRLKAIKTLRYNKKGEFRGKQIVPLKITCNYCKKEFLQYKDRKSKRKFCSLECYRNNLKNRGMSLEAREKIGRASKENWKDPVYKEKLIKAQLKGLMKRPTKYEKRIAELCIERSLPFTYTGDGTFLINFKNPDFVNFEDKIVIEVFFSYYKIRDYGSVENYKKFCKEKYEPSGWKVIFIDETEIDGHYQRGDNWKEVCLNKIIEVKNEK